MISPTEGADAARPDRAAVRPAGGHRRLGRTLDLGTRKQRALVAMLALEPGRVRSMDRLIDELWAGEPPAGATRTPQAYIAHLRKVLEPDRAPRTPPRILLTREFRLMVTTFTCLRGQGRGAEMLDDLVTAAEEPYLVPLRPLAVLAAAEAGRTELAHELMGRWGSEIEDDWIADFLTPVWGLVAARLGTPDPQGLYDRLSPLADQIVVAGMGSAGWGSTRLVLAELAERLGRGDQAREHAQAALDTHRRLGLTHWENQSRNLVTRLRN